MTKLSAYPYIRVSTNSKEQRQSLKKQKVVVESFGGKIGNTRFKNHKAFQHIGSGWRDYDVLNTKVL